MQGIGTQFVTPWRQLEGRFFNTQDAAQRATMSRIGEVAVALPDLRRDFGRGDPWVALLALQTGLRAFDLPMVSSWMATRRPAMPIPILIAPGPNHSASMACMWNALTAYSRGEILRDTIESLASSSEWWPGWTSSDVCNVLDHRSPSAEFGGTLSSAPVTPIGGAVISDATNAGPFAAHEGDKERTGDDDGQHEPGPSATSAVVVDGRPPSTVSTYLDPSGSRFCLLPSRPIGHRPGSHHANWR